MVVENALAYFYAATIVVVDISAHTHLFIKFVRKARSLPIEWS
jgi:hypothetical protein